MDQKNLKLQVVRSLNPTATKKLPVSELIQLSEEDLQQIIGGIRVDLSISHLVEPRHIAHIDKGELKPSKNPGIFIVTGAQSHENLSFLSNNFIYSGGALESVDLA